MRLRCQSPIIALSSFTGYSPLLLPEVTHGIGADEFADILMSALAWVANVDEREDFGRLSSMDGDHSLAGPHIDCLFVVVGDTIIVGDMIGNVEQA